jgi:monofunctional chorismate mutase
MGVLSKHGEDAMTDLTELRNLIDSIDGQLRALYVERLQLVKRIAAYKMEHDLPVYDASREAQIIERSLEAIEDEAIKEKYREVLETIMKTSKDLQKEIVLRSVHDAMD